MKIDVVRLWNEAGIISFGIHVVLCISGQNDIWVPVEFSMKNLHRNPTCTTSGKDFGLNAFSSSQQNANEPTLQRGRFIQSTPEAKQFFSWRTSLEFLWMPEVMEKKKNISGVFARICMP